MDTFRSFSANPSKQFKECGVVKLGWFKENQSHDLLFLNLASTTWQCVGRSSFSWQRRVAICDVVLKSGFLHLRSRLVD